MDTYWVPGVNHLGTYGRWAFAEFTEVYQIEAEFNKLIDGCWLHESAAVADLQAAMTWSAAHAASDTDVEDTLRRLGHGE